MCCAPVIRQGNVLVAPAFVFGVDKSREQCAHMRLRDFSQHFFIHTVVARKLKCAHVAAARDFAFEKFQKRTNPQAITVAGAVIAATTIDLGRTPVAMALGDFNAVSVP